MRVFMLTSDVPSPTGSAVHRVLAEAVAGLSNEGFDLVVQPVLRGDPDHRTHADLAALSAQGVETLEPLTVSEPIVRRVARLVAPHADDFYPATALRREVHDRMRASSAEVAFVQWSPDGLAIAAHGPLPSFVYYGAPDYLALRARLECPEVFDIPASSLTDRIRLAERRRVATSWEHMHFALIRGCTIVANLCRPHAELWRAAGHPNVRYVPNTYPDPGLRDVPRTRRLIGSFGDAGSTGNAFGLHYLGTQLVPALRDRFGEGGFAVDVFGGGTAPRAVEAVLTAPELTRRGWIDDIDGELASAGAFLLLNNAGAYQGAYTRVLHAWSLGTPLVAHAHLAAMMPEVRHGENALLGSTPAELAAAVDEILTDPVRAAELGAAGRAEYERTFRPSLIVSRVADGLRAAYKWSL